MIAAVLVALVIIVILALSDEPTVDETPVYSQLRWNRDEGDEG